MRHMLQSRNFPKFFMRHQNAEGELNEFDPNFGQDFTFDLEQTQFDGKEGIRFRAINSPFFDGKEMYLRHKNFRILLEDQKSSPDPVLFLKDSTFFPRLGLKGPTPESPEDGLSFEASNFPEHFIRHVNFHLFIGKKAGPDDHNFNPDATWIKRPPK
ncbi:AbfB domain-containing protein [Streptomyces sp. NPDC058746]|uniref:AbfB domain-containing protein n=1 Tax=Streptomyces sp. NPDC058746 TaxID=3346622 RepID=UPI00368940D2